MGNSISKKITVGVDDTVKLPIPLRSGLSILNCISQNCSIATCAHNRSTAAVTGRNPGTTVVVVIVGTCLGAIARLVFVIRVIEENEE